MRGRFIAVAAATAALALPVAAGATGWSKPAVVAKASAEDYITPYYVQSPNGRKNDLVVGMPDSRDRVYPMTSRGRLMKPWRLPDRAGYDASYDLNDAGATSIVWLALSSNQPTNEIRGPDYDWVRAAIRRPGGTFTRRRTITPGREIFDYGTAITRRGAATVFASLWNQSAAVAPLRVAEARPNSRFGRPRVIVRDVSDWVLDSRRDRPILLYNNRGNRHPLFELAAPWTHPATIGTLRSEFDFGLGAFASDRNGNELLFSDAVAVSSRRPGGRFGPFRTLARQRSSDYCDVAATMNRRLALAAWSCSGVSTGRLQVAVLSPSGRVRWMSRVFASWPTLDAPSVALDRAGRWVVAWQDKSRNITYDAMTGRGSHHHRVRKIPPPADEFTGSPAVAVLPGGVAHATWESPGRRATYVMESRLRIR